MKWILLCAGLLLLIPSAFSRDPDPLVTDGKRLTAALHKLNGLERNSAPLGRVGPILRTLVEEDSKNASRYFALSRRKCGFDKTTSSHQEAALLSRVALGSLREQQAQAGELLERVNAGEPVTLGDSPVEAPVLWAILAWVRREIAKIQGAVEG
jgi:hypothetical protein